MLDIFEVAMGKFKGDDEEKGILKKFLEYQLKKDIEENEGLYMIGLNIPTIIEQIREEAEVALLDIDREYKTVEEKEKAEQEIKERKAEIEKQKALNKGKPSIEVLEEYVDQDYEKVKRDLMGIREDTATILLNL